MVHLENRAIAEQDRSSWLCLTVTATSALVSALYAIAALLADGPFDDNAGYAASRSVALLIGVVVLLRRRSVSALALLAAVMTVVQTLDAVVGLHSHDLVKTLGPAAVAVLNGVTLAALLHRAQAGARPVDETSR